MHLIAISRDSQPVPFPAKEVLLEFRFENRDSSLMNIFNAGQLITFSRSSKFTIEIIVEAEAEKTLQGTSFQLGNILFDIKSADITQRVYFFDLKERPGLDIGKLTTELFYQGFPPMKIERLCSQSPNYSKSVTDDNVWRIFFGTLYRPTIFNIVAIDDTFSKPCDQLIINGKTFPIQLKNSTPNNWSAYKPIHRRSGISPWALSIDELKSKRIYKATPVSKKTTKQVSEQQLTSKSNSSSEKKRNVNEKQLQKSKKDIETSESKEIVEEKTNATNLNESTALIVSNKLTGFKRKPLEDFSCENSNRELRKKPSGYLHLLADQSCSNLLTEEKEFSRCGSQDVTLIKLVNNLDVLHTSNPFSPLSLLELHLYDEVNATENLDLTLWRIFSTSEFN